VRTYIEKSGVNKQGRCHLFRHTMATLMLENGADIRYIQQMLGHARLSTTEIYTHVSILKLQQVHALTHPARMPDGKAEALHEITRARQIGDETDLSVEAHSAQADAPTAADVLAALDADAAEEDESDT
jgi:integrase/recombinase XerD